MSPMPGWPPDPRRDEDDPRDTDEFEVVDVSEGGIDATTPEIVREALEGDIGQAFRDTLDNPNHPFRDDTWDEPEHVWASQEEAEEARLREWGVK